MPDDRGYITRLARGYQISQVLFAALSLRLFTLLEEGEMNPEELAARAGADRKAIGRLLAAIHDLRLVEQRGGLYRNAGVASRYLVEGRKEYWGNTVHHDSHLWYFWEGLDEQIISGRGKTPPASYLGDYRHRLSDYLAAMDEGASAKAAAIAEVIGIRSYRRMLDVGCGPASYGLAFSKLNPDLSVTLIDLEPSLAEARARVSESRLDERITCHTCHVLEDPIPGGGYDLVFISNLIHLYGTKDVEQILEKAWNVLDDTGAMVLHDYLLASGGSDQLYASLFDLTMLVGTPCGRCYRVDEVAGMLHRLQAKALKVIPVGLGTSLIVARKTEADVAVD